MCVAVAVGVAVAGTHLIALEGNDGVLSCLSCPVVWREMRSAWCMSCSGMCCHPREDVFQVCAGIALPRRSLSAWPAFSLCHSTCLALFKFYDIFICCRGGRKKVLHVGNMSMHLWVAVLPLLPLYPVSYVICLRWRPRVVKQKRKHVDFICLLRFFSFQVFIRPHNWRNCFGSLKAFRCPRALRPTQKGNKKCARRRRRNLCML